MFSVFLMCFQCVFCCVFRRNALFRAQREENFFSVIVCFQYIFSVFSLCFRFFGFSVFSVFRFCVFDWGNGGGLVTKKKQTKSLPNPGRTGLGEWGGAHDRTWVLDIE